MDNRPIGVFDSGVGGLTSVKVLHSILPHEDIVYFGDTARVPYGSRSSETIINFAKQDLEFLLSKNVKAVLIACGTVSSTSIKELRKMTDVPIVGIIEPAANRAVFKTENKRIGVLATAATISTHAYSEAIKKIDPKAEVFEKACPLFVPLIENGYFDEGNKITQLVVEDYLKELRELDVDAVILGCTHYPLIEHFIQEALPNAKVISASKEAAYALLHMYEFEPGLEADPEHEGTVEYYVSDITQSFKEVCEIFLGEPMDCEVKKYNFE